MLIQLHSDIVLSIKPQKTSKLFGYKVRFLPFGLPEAAQGQMSLGPKESVVLES